MPGWLIAGGWGAVAGGALVVGAAIAYTIRLRERWVAGAMSFGAGVLIAALAFELVGEAVELGGLLATAAGFAAGALVYSAANVALARFGARHRKRSGAQQPSEAQQSGSGLAIALGALLDGVPESIVIGVSTLAGRGVSLVTVAAVFLSNVPESLSSAAGMKKAGRSAGYIFGVWGGIAGASALAAIVGAALFSGASPALIAGTDAIAGGAILAMLADTMMPEASEGTPHLAGLLTAAGFLSALVLRAAAA